MNAVTAMLEGSVAYLLIGEIVAVASLFLSFLWMMALRVRQLAIVPSSPGATNSGGSVDVESSQVYKQLNAKFQSLQAEYDRVLPLKNEYDGLVNKVKFLESKLLEYEILQEEIGALSQLKADNEKLKLEVVRLQGGASATAPSAELAPVSEAVSSSVAAAQPAPEPEPTLAQAAAPVEAAPAPVAAAPAPATPPPAEAGSSPQDQIDALMAEFSQNPTSMDAAPAAPAAPATPAVNDIDDLLKSIDALSHGDEEKKS